jgi:hypothetical protein
MGKPGFAPLNAGADGAAARKVGVGSRRSDEADFTAGFNLSTAVTLRLGEVKDTRLRVRVLVAVGEVFLDERADVLVGAGLVFAAVGDLLAAVALVDEVLLEGAVLAAVVLLVAALLDDLAGGVLAVFAVLAAFTGALALAGALAFSGVGVFTDDFHAGFVVGGACVALSASTNSVFAKREAPGMACLAAR